MLDARFSAEPGPWRTSRVPHAEEWLNTANAPWVHRLSVMASTQVSKSETGNNLLAYYMAHRPSPMMLVLPREADAKLAVMKRVRPMLRASRVLRAELTGRRGDFNEREITLRRSILYMRAAQSPADLAMVPVRLVIGDECDKWPQWTGKESSPWNLVLERVRTFPDYLAVLMSTPTTRAGLIHREFQKGDRRRRYMPCPHCSAWIVFEWAQVRWTAGVRTVEQFNGDGRRAWYECQACGESIDEPQRREMMQRGEWVPEDWRERIDEWIEHGREADRAPHRSYHLWAAYSPWLSWSALVEKFLASKDDPSDLMNWVNSWLAELWEERIGGTSDETVKACIDEDRAIGEVPPSVRVVTAAVDVQHDRLYWQSLGWANDEESFVIACGWAATFEEVGEILFGQTWGPQQLPMRCVLVDSRHRREEVMEFCRSYAPVARMIAGVERDMPQPFGTVKIDRHPRTGLPLPTSMIVWTVNVAMFKDLVAHRMALAAPQEATTNAEPVGRIHLPHGIPPDELAHLSSEHKVLERKAGKARARWVLKPGHQRNEGWDCLVYNMAAGRMVRVHLLRSPGRSATASRAMPQRPTPSTNPRPPMRPSSMPRGSSRFPLLPGER